MRFSNVRCNVCDRVSHSEIAREAEDHFSGRFYEDNRSFGWICQECADEIDEIESEYYFDEEDND